ncbi:MAG: hypothetical protein A3D26_03320 [Candidatus Blackburnbacteria bacterium RIFCSPHIGHO2_02_FULL_44_20]|uniref:Uncharacterized protein n=1 Tax=Candidatus Blackburnbacteria bacterium RIFCSPHIGHO2_02_FULL_44_20 TaxID=1797516 RepID=A0A1G1V7X4_9BACT|nr:MAG: hypothetical protein A3E16_01325 [Candidatus Blackburnbacteria bacterium RIFCSPHIGHO2_12_FULL_44_25]OGY11554.1 MAG: hypothetical protein A3D26_03320 [Candidatus Blackburnbacteria bacterium RIFCSPHIGHO2_02_FULL_44_20]
MSERPRPDVRQRIVGELRRTAETHPDPSVRRRAQRQLEQLEELEQARAAARAELEKNTAEFEARMCRLSGQTVGPETARYAPKRR